MFFFFKNECSIYIITEPFWQTFDYLKMLKEKATEGTYYYYSEILWDQQNSYYLIYLPCLILLLLQGLDS